MRFLKVTGENASEYSDLFTLYQSSFPEKERRTLLSLKALLHNSSMHFNAIIHENAMLGFVIEWQFETFIFLEHFAIFPENRNQNWGKKVIDKIAENLSKPILLEVEPPTSDMAKRRIGFYERNGFVVVDKHYRQPVYDSADQFVPLWLMSTRNLEKNLLSQEIIPKIHQKVYARNKFINT